LILPFISEHLFFGRNQQPVGSLSDYFVVMLRFRVSRKERHVRRITATLARTNLNALHCLLGVGFNTLRSFFVMLSEIETSLIF
jgi:hypothetical protein